MIRDGEEEVSRRLEEVLESMRRSIASIRGGNNL